MRLIRKFLSFILKFFLVIVLVVGVIFAGSFVWYMATRKSALDFLPDSFIAYVKVDSISDFYGRVIDLKAADVVFSEVPQLKSVRKAMMDFKSGEMARSFLLRQLLGVEVHAVINQDQTPVLVFDTGLLSVPLRLFPVANLFVKIEGVPITTYNKGSHSVYAAELGEKDRIFFSIIDNLVLVSTGMDPIENCYALRAKGATLAKNDEAKTALERLKQKGVASLIVNTKSILGSITGTDPVVRSILAEISFDTYSALAFDISNAGLSLEAITGFRTENERLRTFAAFTPPGQRSLTIVGESTNIFTSISSSSFRELIEIVSAFKEKDPDKITKQIDDACRLLFNVPADDLLFAWIGNEAGMLNTGTSFDPIVFVKIKDRARLDATLKTIAGSVLLDEDSSLVLDGVRLTKIVLPEFLKALAGLFVKGLDTPYYLVMSDYIFFSMDPKNLAALDIAYRSNSTLGKNEDFRKVSLDVPKNGHVSFYYNLKESVPDFLGRSSLITKVLSNYEKGIISLFFRENELRINLAAGGSSQSALAPCPGYPRQLPGGTATDVIVCDVKGSKAHELVYISQDGKLTIMNAADGTYVRTDAEPNSELLVVRNPEKGKDDVYVFADSGMLTRFDGDANPVAPFPLTTIYGGSFPPVEHDGKIVLYSQSEKSLGFISPTGEESTFPFAFEQPLLSPPFFGKGIVAFYPKNFSGTVYCTEDDGRVIDGWPKDGGGVSFSSPIIFESRGGEQPVAFLTQAGVLTLWDRGGNTFPGFPIDIEGVFAVGPVPVSTRLVPGYGGAYTKAILALDTEGTLTMVDADGTRLLERKISEARGKNSRIVLNDYNRDGVEEIFIYGSSNYIVGLGKELGMIPGFPVRGSKKCGFADINADGTLDLVAASFDGNLYAYELGR